MNEVGILEWSGERFAPNQPAATVKNHASVADLLLEDRR